MHYRTLIFNQISPLYAPKKSVMPCGISNTNIYIYIYILNKYWEIADGISSHLSVCVVHMFHDVADMAQISPSTISGGRSILTPMA